MKARIHWVFLLALIFLGTACRPDNDYIYEVNEITTEAKSVEKINQKTEEQYLSILYANLFQKALSANELVELINLVQSCGDKETIHEVIISSFMNSPDKIIPTDQEMRADIGKFIEDTYQRFYVRKPSEAEKTWFINFIQADDNITPELVYMSFALGNEYLYY